MTTNMKKSWKVLLYVIGAIVLVILVAFVAGSYANNPQRLNAASQANANKLAVAMGNTTSSYVFSSDGTVITTPASPLITLLINGSNQPLRVTSPASLTLTWKIDSSIDGSSCSLSGPYDGLSGSHLYVVGDQSNPTVDGYREFMNEHGVYVGSLEFKNVVPGTAKTAPVYQGVAQFVPGANEFDIQCAKVNENTVTQQSASVGVWINQ